MSGIKTPGIIKCQQCISYAIDLRAIKGMGFFINGLFNPVEGIH